MEGRRGVIGTDCGMDGESACRVRVFGNLTQNRELARAWAGHGVPSVECFLSVHKARVGSQPGCGLHHVDMWDL